GLKRRSPEKKRKVGLSHLTNQGLLFFFNSLKISLEFSGDLVFTDKNRFTDNDFRHTRGSGNTGLRVYLGIDLLVCLVIPYFKYLDVHIRIFFCHIFNKRLDLCAMGASLAIEIINDAI